MRKTIFIIVTFIIFATFQINAEDSQSDEKKTISNGYKEFKLGMSRDEVKKKLKYSAEFAPEHIEAVQTRLEPDAKTITASGVNPINGLIRIAYFYFDDDDNLQQIFLQLNEYKISYQMILKRFTTKYDNPSIFEPNRAVWSDDSTTITLEKPCILKYNKNDSDSDKQQNTDILYNKLREKFIEDL